MGGGIVGIEAPPPSPQQAQGGELVALPSHRSTSGVTKGEGVRGQGLQGHLHMLPVSISIWTLCRQDNHCDKFKKTKKKPHSVMYYQPVLLV